MTCASKYNDVFMMENGSAVVNMLKRSLWCKCALLCLEQAHDMLESVASCTNQEVQSLRSWADHKGPLGNSSLCKTSEQREAL